MKNHLPLFECPRHPQFYIFWIMSPPYEIGILNQRQKLYNWETFYNWSFYIFFSIKKKPLKVAKVSFNKIHPMKKIRPSQVYYKNILLHEKLRKIMFQGHSVYLWFQPSSYWSHPKATPMTYKGPRIMSNSKITLSLAYHKHTII